MVVGCVRYAKMEGIHGFTKGKKKQQVIHNFIEQDQSSICFSVLKRPHPRVSSMLVTLA